MDTTNNSYIPNTWISAWGEEMYHDINNLPVVEYNPNLPREVFSLINIP